MNKTTSSLGKTNTNNNKNLIYYFFSSMMNETNFFFSPQKSSLLVLALTKFGNENKNNIEIAQNVVDRKHSQIEIDEQKNYFNFSFSCTKKWWKTRVQWIQRILSLIWCRKISGIHMRKRNEIFRMSSERWNEEKSYSHIKCNLYWFDSFFNLVGRAWYEFAKFSILLFHFFRSALD